MAVWYSEAGYSLSFPPQYRNKEENTWTGRKWTRDQEQKLVERAIKRDSAAFTELYDTYVEKIFKYVFYKTGHRTEAEDITAQVFLKAWEAIGHYQWTDRPFASWLYRIAHNLVVDHFRASQEMVNLEDVHSLEERGMTLDDIVDQHLTSGMLQQMLKRLTQEQQQVIILRFLEGYDTAQTARIMNKTEGAVRTLQHRALNSLNRVMARHAAAQIEFTRE